MKTEKKELHFIEEVQRDILNRSVKEARKSLLNMNYTEISKIHAKALINNKIKVFGFQLGTYILIENVESLEAFKFYFIE